MTFIRKNNDLILQNQKTVKSLEEYNIYFSLLTKPQKPPLTTNVYLLLGQLSLWPPEKGTVDQNYKVRGYALAPLAVTLKHRKRHPITPSFKVESRNVTYPSLGNFNTFINSPDCMSGFTLDPNPLDYSALNTLFLKHVTKILELTPRAQTKLRFICIRPSYPFNLSYFAFWIKRLSELTDDPKLSIDSNRFDVTVPGAQKDITRVTLKVKLRSQPNYITLEFISIYNTYIPEKSLIDLVGRESRDVQKDKKKKIFAYNKRYVQRNIIYNKNKYNLTVLDVVKFKKYREAEQSHFVKTIHSLIKTQAYLFCYFLSRLSVEENHLPLFVTKPNRVRFNSFRYRLYRQYVKWTQTLKNKYE